MELELRHPFSTRQQLHHICIGALVTALLAASMGSVAASGDQPYASDNDSGISGVKGMGLGVGSRLDTGASDNDKFWEYFFLDNLEKALHRRIAHLNDESSLELDNDEPSYLQDGRDKRKVLGVAGLDNFDVMTKTLDRTRTRNRLPMMMSVPRMNTSRLRMLMESQGRRRK